jgi:hypothetical protein
MGMVGYRAVEAILGAASPAALVAQRPTLRVGVRSDLFYAFPPCDQSMIV